MSSSSRENSPDWLRSYQVPNQPTVALSSSESLSQPSDDEDETMLSKLFKKEVNQEEIASDQEKEISQTNMIIKSKSPAKDRKTLHPDKIESNEDEEVSRANKILKPKSPANKQKADRTPGRKRKRELLYEKEEKRAAQQAAQTKASEKPVASTEPNVSVWALSSDSESCPDSKPVNMDADLDKRSVNDISQYGETENDEVAILGDEELPHEVSIMRTPKRQNGKKPLGTETGNSLKSGGNSGEMDVEEDIHEKPNGHNISSRLPLVLSEKVQRSKALLECDGDSIDLSGDVGAVGRVVISDDSSGNHEMLLDLKGTVYRTSIVPSRTFCVVSFGQSEAKVEAIMNDFIQLRPESNVYDTETMVEGTLEGFSFDSDDDVDNLPKATLPTNQNEDAEEQPNGKNKQRSQKPSGGKKVKIAGGKPAKKARKKPQAPRKGKSKK